MFKTLVQLVVALVVRGLERLGALVDRVLLRTVFRSSSRARCEAIQREYEKEGRSVVRVREVQSGSFVITERIITPEIEAAQAELRRLKGEE